VWIGRLSMAEATQLYPPQGPFVSVHSGNIRLIAGTTPDLWTVAMTNTFGVVQREMLRYFNLPGLGMILPSNVSPTISDSVVA
jgi:hypothetical protein